MSKKNEEQEKEYTLEDANSMKITIEPIINLVDVTLGIFDFDYAEHSLNELQSKASTMMGASVIFGNDGLDRADAMEVSNELYKAVINLYRVRKKQRELALKQRDNKGKVDELFKALGG